jgi:UDP-3-O-[3-hydroxymyristoyl] N-acetylglucosamine deacetylase/3-hydroxyacyl-[acyl-carrier-protein] dehydratase
MSSNQRSIAGPVSLAGIGVHTGSPCTMTFCPAPPHYGVKFVRTDLPDSPEVPADIEQVVGTERGTTLGLGEIRVHTVEHALAALLGLGIDNCRVELDSNEPPFGDGSALPFVEVLKKAEVVEQDASRRCAEFGASVSFMQGDVSLVAIPAAEFRISFTLDFDHKVLKSQYLSLEIGEERFIRDISPARTFCFMKDVEPLREKGLIKGGSLECAVVIGDDGIVNPEGLRFPDEFVRHKIADLMGDLALLGALPRAHIIAIKSGHATNVPFVRELRKRMGRKPLRLPMDAAGIQSVIPHRYPMLLVDRILEIEERKRIVGLKNVTLNEPFFQGHFPGHPIMPGVLQIEAMAQVGGFLLLSTVKDPENKLVYFLEIDKAKFRKPVLPGDTIRFELEMTRLKGRVCRMKGVGTVEGNPVVEAELTAMIVDK